MLRDYQKKAIDEIRILYAKGIKRVLLQLAGGGGKTVIFCDIIKRTQARNFPCLIVVRGVKLIEQASLRLTREGVAHGVQQGQNSHSEYLPVQVCSIDTLYRRKQAPPARLIIVDEAHLSQGEGYKWFLSQYPNSYILGVTATPFLKKGLRHIADEIVYPISILDLMNQGYLVRPKYYAPEKPELSDIEVRQGEYNTKQLDNRMQENAIHGDVVKTWQRLGENRPSLIFAVSIKHSQLLARKFNEAGIPTEHIDANTNQAERNEIIDRLISGKIKIISSVGTLTTGFDCPPVSCLIICRPTLSKNLHFQIIYRGTRPYENKNDFIVLDHAGNLERHGFIEDEIKADLDGKALSGKAGIAPVKNCPACFSVYYVSCQSCPSCGEKNESAQKNKERKLQELEAELVERKRLNQEEQISKWIQIAKTKKLKKGWIYHMIKGRYGEKVANEKWAKIKVMPKWV